MNDDIYTIWKALPDTGECYTLEAIADATGLSSARVEAVLLAEVATFEQGTSVEGTRYSVAGLPIPGEERTYRRAVTS